MERKLANTTIPLTCSFTHILFNLASQGYSHIKIEYSGYGDSGGIDNTVLIERGGVEEKEDGIRELEDCKKVDVAQELKDLIEEKAYTHILNSVENCYDNEGGGGTLYISCDDGKYLSDHYVHEIITNYETLEGKFED